MHHLDPAVLASVAGFTMAALFLLLRNRPGPRQATRFKPGRIVIARNLVATADGGTDLIARER